MSAIAMTTGALSFWFPRKALPVGTGPVNTKGPTAATTFFGVVYGMRQNGPLNPTHKTSPPHPPPKKKAQTRPFFFADPHMFHRISFQHVHVEGVVEHRDPGLEIHRPKLGLGFAFTRRREVRKSGLLWACHSPPPGTFCWGVPQLEAMLWQVWPIRQFGHVLTTSILVDVGKGAKI